MSSDKPDTSVRGFKVPRHRSALNGLFKKARPFGRSIHHLSDLMFASGSGTTEVQHIMLRVLSLRQQSRETLKSRLALYGIDESFEEAVVIVEQSTELQVYFSILENRIPVASLVPGLNPWPGAFKPARDLQEQLAVVGGVDTMDVSIRLDIPRPRNMTTRGVAALSGDSPIGDSPYIIKGYDPDATRGKKRHLASATSLEEETSHESSYSHQLDDEMAKDLPDADDETSVNTALLLLLKELSFLVRKREVEWTVDRVRFAPQFAKGGFTTCTDGAFLLRHSNRIIAIVEAKRRLRSKDPKSIMMQEAAELVGWLLDSRAAEFPGLNSHALLISQDRHQIFLSFAKITPEYLDYLRNPQSSSRALMPIQPYGPYNIFLREHMEELATLIVALTLMASG
ncbi:hypothetical protein BJX64DRAFT_289872 [Aspergillus heterothallicus]